MRDRSSPGSAPIQNGRGLRSFVWVFSAVFWLAMACISMQQSYECVRKYLDYKIVEDVSLDTETPVSMPAISFCPFPSLKFNDTSQTSQKNLSVAQACPNRTDYAVCLQQYFYSREDMVVGGYQADTFDMDDRLWKPAPLSFAMGMCYTMLDANASSVSGNYLDTMLEFDISNRHNISVIVYIHNPGEFIPSYGISTDGFFLPQSFFGIDSQALQFSNVYLSVGRRINMNTKSRPCLNNASYSPSRCYEQYVGQRLGCATPWQVYPSQTPLMTCSTLDDFQNFIDISYHLFYITSAAFTQETGCQAPCSYDTYDVQILTNPNDAIGQELLALYNGTSSSCVVVTLRSSNKTIVRETYLYDTSSLVGELGGSLGLFLGVSFATVPSLVDALVQYVENKLGKKREAGGRMKK